MYEIWKTNIVFANSRVASMFINCTDLQVVGNVAFEFAYVATSPRWFALIQLRKMCHGPDMRQVLR